MKFIHVADIHASRERLPQTLSIINTLTDRAKTGDIDFIVFAGDFWDSTITATKGSGFSDIIAAVRELEKHVYRIFFIYGTPSHEPSGSLDVFKSDKTFVCSENFYKIEIVPCKNQNQKKTDIPAVTLFDLVLIPEPRRSNYITKSAKETDEIINSDIKTFIKSVDDRDKNTPRVVVYHGEVKGAQYQNGVSASSPTAIPKKLLQSLNADYYALGHIHMPQEVFENAWYPGSACPKNFGEIHDGHYNLVTIENGKTEVEQVSFELPIYQTYRVNYPFESPHGDWSNYHIRLQFDCTKEERKTLNIKELSDSIKEHTHALSVKLEPNVIEGEAIQTSEVSKRKSLVEKLTAYAKEKGLRVPKHTKDILQNIQDGTLAKLAFPQHSFELLSLSLRGAIGIRDGQGVEEIQLNFERYEDGVVCLVGHNGVGKSTLVENCHPYPKMLSRKGTLQDHFYLKDSHRILIYKDENGLYYRISMLIDGKTANGKVAYFVETSKNRETWKSVPDVDGSSDAYKEWVNNTFGTIDVYLRTAFFAKEQTKDATDIADTTKSERMEFLSKLAGTDQLKEVSVIARESRKELEDNSYEIEAEINAYSQYEETIKENERDIKKWNNELKAQENAISVLDKEIEELKTADAEYQKSVALAESNKALYEQYQNKKEELLKQCGDLDKAIGCYDNISKISENKKYLSESSKKIPTFQKDIAAKKKEIENVESEISKIEKERDKMDKEFCRLEVEIKLLKQQIVPVSDTCPTCGAKLSADKYAELSSVVKDNESKLHKLIAEQNKYVIPEEDEDWSLVPLTSKKKTLEDELYVLECALDVLINGVTDCNAFLELWGDYEKFADKTKDELETEMETLQAQLKEIDDKLDDIVYDACVRDVTEELKETEEKLKREVNRKADITASIKSAEKENARYQKELKSVEDKKAELKLLQEKIIAYNFIEDAFSNKGIPAVELRESAPEIADIANQILKDSYGNKFEIRFGNSSELKAKKKADEDFNIIVTDTENFDEKTIDLVSSGERIWLKQALFYAFSIVQMNRTGFNFRTRLIDESDGSLDGTLRPKYLKMVEAAHKISNSRITILITHSQEIKDIAQQVIEI